MKLFNLMNTFARDEDGAVTVDWVVLTAAIVGLGIAILTWRKKAKEVTGQSWRRELHRGD